MNNPALPSKPLLHLRFAAGIYDFFPLLPIWFFSAAACLLATNGTLDYHAWWYRTVMLIVTAAYFVVSWSRGGQTIGLKAWRLRVSRTDGSRLSLLRAMLRFFIAMVSLFTCGLGFLWALFDPQYRTWHDIAAGTVVQRLPK